MSSSAVIVKHLVLCAGGMSMPIKSPKTWRRDRSERGIAERIVMTGHGIRAVPPADAGLVGSKDA
jgi:hypothetical protein